MLRLHIDGAWEPKDFIDVLRSVESMYYKLSSDRLSRYGPTSFYVDPYLYFSRDQYFGAQIEGVLDAINERLLARARYEALSDERLMVRSVEYASPGSIDLLGIGKVVEVVAYSVGRIVKYYDERHLRRERDAQAKLETEIKKETLQSLKIQNAKDALELFKRFPDEADSLIALLVRDQDALSERIAERKLLGAEVSSADRQR